MRFWVAILFIAGLSACADIGDDARYQFGVSAEPAAATPVDSASVQNLLAWKASQICTQGYQVVRQDAVKTEDGGQIVDNHLRCNPYHPSIGLTDFSLPTIF